jgi:alkylated DNA repair protein (DNA oxidative demethylase)
MIADAVLPFEKGMGDRQTLGPGAVWFKRYLPVGQQRRIAERATAIIEGPGGGYVPTVRGGGKMHVRMTSLGRHWNPLTYTYMATRADHDQAPVQPVPTEWVTLASQIAADAGFDFTPDIALVNWYGPDGRMGLHQDKDEGAASIAAGKPVVSISIGDTARFLFGGLKRRDPVDALMLESGDVFVFGGEARLRYHGVSRIVAGSAPPELGLSGRFNLTFREY